MLQFSLYFSVVIKRCMRFQQKKKNCTKDKNEPHEHIMFIQSCILKKVWAEKNNIVCNHNHFKSNKKPKMQRTREP